jgi:hypothetical protein
LANDLKPFIEAHRRLIARWSCSMMYFNVTANPTAQWTAQQIVEAFP